MLALRSEGPTGLTVVPGGCSLTCTFRFAPGRTVEDAKREVMARARLLGATAAVTDRAPAGPAILDNPLLQEFRAVTAAPIEAKQAWTDVAQLARVGIPAANFGPGEQAQAHQGGESCPEPALERAHAMLERVLREA